MNIVEPTNPILDSAYTVLMAFSGPVDTFVVTFHLAAAPVGEGSLSFRVGSSWHPVLPTTFTPDRLHAYRAVRTAFIERVLEDYGVMLNVAHDAIEEERAIPRVKH